MEKNISIQCDKCGAKFSDNRRLLRHNREIRCMAKFKCEKCGDKFPTKKDYEAHTYNISKCANIANGEIKCTNCGLVYKKLKWYEKHFAECSAQKENPGKVPEEEIIDDLDDIIEDVKKEKEAIQDDKDAKIAELTAKLESITKEHDELKRMYSEMASRFDNLHKGQLETIQTMARSIQSLATNPGEKSVNSTKTVNNIVAKKATVNNITNINYIAFGDKPDTKGIKTKEVLEIANESVHGIVPAITKLVHANSKLPKNHNVYVDKGKTFVLLEDGSWAESDQNSVLTKLFSEAHDLITEADKLASEGNNNGFALSDEQRENLSTIEGIAEGGVDSSSHKEFIGPIMPVLQGCKKYAKR